MATSIDRQKLDLISSLNRLYKNLHIASLNVFAIIEVINGNNLDDNFQEIPNIPQWNFIEINNELLKEIDSILNVFNIDDGPDLRLKFDSTNITDIEGKLQTLSKTSVSTIVTSTNISGSSASSSTTSSASSSSSSSSEISPEATSFKGSSSSSTETIYDEPYIPESPLLREAISQLESKPKVPISLLPSTSSRQTTTSSQKLRGTPAIAIMRNQGETKRRERTPLPTNIIKK